MGEQEQDAQIADGQGGQEGQGGGTDGQGGQEGQDGGTDQKAASKTVPYERLEAVSKQNQELRAQMRQIQEELQASRLPLEEQKRLHDRLEKEKQFYRDAYGYVEGSRESIEKRIAELEAKLTQTVSHVNGASSGQILRELRQAPGYSQELEDSMVKVIEEEGIDRRDAAKAIRSAYRMVTGKPFGHWVQDGYSTRGTKERISRPGNSVTGGAGLTPEKLANMTAADLRKLQDEGKLESALAQLRASVRGQ